MKLEIGHGIRPQEGYTTLDIDPKTNPDILGDVRDIPLENESVDEVVWRHGPEHLFWGDILWAFSEINRVLKKGGRFIVETPDFEIVKNYDIDKLYEFFDAIYMDKAGDRREILYNSDELFDDDFKEGFNHLCIFDEKKMLWFLEKTGFASKRDRDAEIHSIHKWNSSLIFIAEKVSIPQSPLLFQKEIGTFLSYMRKYKYVEKYIERYG